MDIFEFLKRLKDDTVKTPGSDDVQENRATVKKKTTMELEEFLYLAAKMVINNEASTKTTHIKAFIIDEISEKELRIVKEEIKYLMFCLLHFYAYAEIAVNKKIWFYRKVCG